MKMIKRTLCLVLSLIMVIGMFPMQALATDEGLEMPVQPVEVAAPQPEIVPEVVSFPEMPVIEAPVVESVPAEIPAAEPVIPEVPVIEEVPALPVTETHPEEIIVPEIPVVEVPSVPVKLWFACSPAELSLYVYDAYGVPVAADADGGYSLLPGDYFYCAYCEGYLPAEMVYVNVPAGIGSMSAEIVLTALVPILPEAPDTEGDVTVDAGEENVESIMVTEPVSFAAVAGSFNGSAAEVDENGNLLINEANFPDAIFREFVSAVYDSGKTGVLSEAQVAGIREINVAGNGIASLKGIEYFTAITELVCSYNNLTALDLSRNTALVNLDCSSNSIETLDVSANAGLSLLVCSYNNLSTLDVSANTGLTTLDCSYNNLSALDVSANTQLTKLNCAYNRIRTLDVSKLVGLAELYCEGNLLSTLDLSKNSALISVHCYEQGAALSAYWEGDKLLYNMSELVGSDLDAVVDISVPYDPATGIVTLCAGGSSDIQEAFSYALDITAGSGLVANFSANATVTIPENENIIRIDETNFPDAAFRAYVTELLGGKFTATRGQLAQITEIDCTGMKIASLEGIEYFTGLKKLVCADNFITTLDLSKNTALTELVCVNNKLTVLDLSHYSGLTRLEVSGQTVSADAYWAGDKLSFDLAGLVGAENKALISDVVGAAYDKESGIVTLGILPGDMAQSASFKYQLSLGGGNAWVKSMEVTVILAFPEYSGEKLPINEENFPDAAFRSFVTELLDKSGAGYLTASQLESVIEIDCSNKGITSLKGIEYFTALRTLVCSGNSLTELDVSALSALRILDCSGNNISALDLSANTALKTLECSNNAIAALDLSVNTALESLICSQNALSSLDVSGCKTLTSLFCDENELSQLVLGENAALEILWCANNKLSELDLSTLTALAVLNCEQNGLGALDVSANTALTSLLCGNQESARNAYWSGNDLCFDLSALVGKSNLSKISNVSSERYNASTGVVILQTAEDTDYVSQFGYTYTVSGDNTMDVTIQVLRPDKPAGGSAGENIDWVFDPATGTINVTGSGDMEDFVAGSAPWDEYKDKISSIVVGSGVTSIADNAFSGLSSVKSLELPDGLTSIGDGAFSGMSSLESIDIPSGVTSIGSGAFSGCTALEEIKLNSTNAPSCDWNSTVGVNATIRFPASNSSWLEAMEKTAGGENTAFTWRIAGSESYSEHIKTLVETYSDSAACVIGISENVKLDTGITVPGKVSLIVNEGVTLELKGQLNVKGSASINGSLIASNLTVNGSLETAPGSSITVTDFATYGPVSLKGGTVESKTLKIYDGSVIDISGGASLNVSSPTGLTNPKSILINVDGTAYTEPGQAVSENVFPHINYIGAQPKNDAELAALLAADVARMDVTIVSDLKLTGDTAIGTNVSLSVSGGSLSTGGYTLTNNGAAKLAANLNVNEGGSFTNNGTLVFAGGNVVVGQGASVNQGSGSCAFDEGFGARIEDIDMLIKLGLKEMKLKDTQYELKEDLTLPSTVSVELDNVQLTIPEGLRLVRNGSDSILLTNGSILTINGSYDGPEIAMYEGCQVLPEEKISYKHQEGDIIYVSVGIPVADSISISDAEGKLLSDGEIHTVDMSEGTTYQLKINVEPENASKRVTWKSDNTAVATVSETGLVTFLKLGQVSFTATTVDPGKKTATATLDVVFAGIDVKTKFTAAIDTESCGFAEPQPLNIGLQMGDSVQMYVYGTDKTQPLPASLFTYAPANAASAKLIEVDPDTGVITAIKDGGTASVMAVFRDDPVNRSVTVSVKTIPVQAGRIKVVPTNLADTRIMGIDGNGHICSLDGAVSYAIFVDKIPQGTPTAQLPTFTVSLDVTGTDGEKMPIIKGKHTWASTGTNLATVKENADGTATITLKANVDGACTVTATAKDTTKAQGGIAIYIVDYAPRLEAASVTLDSQMLGTVTLGMVESYEAHINSIELRVYNTKTKLYEPSADFSVELIKGIYEDSSGHAVELVEAIAIKANKFLKNQTVKAQLYGNVMAEGANGGLRPFEVPLNVVIKNSIPTVTVKQLTKINSFYTDSTADFTVTIKNVEPSQIENMYFVPDVSKGAAASFISDPYAPGSGVVTLRLADSVSKLNTKGTLYIKLSGYNSEIEKAVTVSAAATKPSIVLDPASIVINTAAIKDENLLSVRLSEKNGRVLDLSEGEAWFIGTVPDGIELIASGDTLSLLTDKTTLEAYKGGKLQISVQDNGWTGAVTVNLNITKSSSAATLKLAKTTLSLNSAYADTADQTRLMFSYANMNIAELDVTVAAAKPNEETAKLNVGYDKLSGTVSAGIKEGETPKAGSYSYTLTAKQGETEYKAITFTVKVANTPPSVKLSKTSLSLSSSYVLQTDSFTVSPATVGHTLFSINEITSKATAANAAEYEKIGFNVNGNVLEAYIKDQFKSNPPKAGTYSYSLLGELDTADGLADFKAINFTVKVLSTAPAAKLSKTSVTLNNVFTDYEESTQVLPSNAAHQLNFFSLEAQSKPTTSNAAEIEKIDIAFDHATQSIVARIKDQYKANPPKTGTYSFTITGKLSTDGTDLGEGYFKPLTLSVKVVNTLPKVTLSATTLNLNTTENLVGVEKGMISLVAPAGYEVVSAKVERTDTNAATLAQSEKIVVSGIDSPVTDGKIFASLDEDDLPKAASYKFKVTPRVQAIGSLAASVELAPINFTVKVYANAKYSATVSASGKLDAAIRTNFITYTLTKLTNISGEVMGVALSGQDADKFNVELSGLNAKGQPTVKLSLKDGVGYATNVTYKVQLDFALKTNYAEQLVVSTNVLSVKVSSTALKLTGEPKLNNIYQSQSRSRIVYYTVKLTSPADARIGSIAPGVTGLLQQSLVNEYTNVSSVISADGKSATIKVVIKDTSKLSANKTYTLPLLISAEGGATNAATKLNLSLKVFK